MPSATMALLRPHMPAMIFAADKMRLVKNPTQVTRAAFFSGLLRYVVFSVHNGVMLLYKCKAFRGYFVSFALCHRLIYNGST